MKSKINQFSFAALLLVFTFSLGCSASSEPDVMTNQDELSKWTAENPPPTDIEIDPALNSEGL